jgi:alpha-1,3-glucosyltransferase
MQCLELSPVGLLIPSQGRKLLGGLLFAVLLNFKHIYMYLAASHFKATD